MSTICFVVVFNHRFDANLPKLDAIYRDRFKHVHYLMPFYNGPREDVVPVYENSHRFQGFFSQAAPYLIQPSYSHYVFAADDLVLNPSINCHNLLSVLSVEDSGPHTGYIKSVQTLGETTLSWEHVLTSRETLRRARGVQFAPELPEADQARVRLRHHGLHDRDLGLANLRGWHGLFERGLLKRIGRLARWKISNRRQGVSAYPLVGGYSDFIVVPAAAMQNFTHYCGVFAALGLFAEVAVPTALALSCESLRTEKSSRMQGTELWQASEIDELATAHGYSIQQLFQAFPDRLYFHPIKLSRWN